MEPNDTFLSEYFLSERDLDQLMEYLVAEQSNAGTLLAFTDEIRLEPGQVLIRQGDSDAAVYILTEGTLEVLVEDGGKERPVAKVDAYALVGEQSFIDGAPRTATVVAHTDCVAHRLTDAAFEQVRDTNPDAACAFLIDVSRALAQRLRQRSTAARS